MRISEKLLALSNQQITAVTCFVIFVTLIYFTTKLFVHQCRQLCNKEPFFGPSWKEFLKEYDDIWNEVADKLKTKGQEYVSTKIDTHQTMGPGSLTQVHICGKRTNPVLLLLPGFRGTSLMWVRNVSDLSNHYCVICVDYPFDLGRSVPGHLKDCDDVVENTRKKGASCEISVIKYTQLTCRNFPSEQGLLEVIAWIREVLQKLNVSQLSALAGFSLGAYISSHIALKAPDLLKPKAPLFLCAPPTMFSNFPVHIYAFIHMLNDFSRITGLPLIINSMLFYKHSLWIDKIYKTIEDNIFPYACEAGDRFSGPTPIVPFLPHVLSDGELKSIKDSFSPTYYFLKRDIFYKAKMSAQKSKNLGIDTVIIEGSHMIVSNQAKKFHKILLDKLI